MKSHPDYNRVIFYLNICQKAENRFYHLSQAIPREFIETAGRTDGKLDEVGRKALVKRWTLASAYLRRFSENMFKIRCLAKNMLMYDASNKLDPMRRLKNTHLRDSLCVHPMRDLSVLQGVFESTSQIEMILDCISMYASYVGLEDECCLNDLEADAVRDFREMIEQHVDETYYVEEYLEDSFKDLNSLSSFEGHPDFLLLLLGIERIASEIEFYECEYPRLTSQLVLPQSPIVDLKKSLFKFDDNVGFGKIPDNVELGMIVKAALKTVVDNPDLPWKALHRYQVKTYRVNPYRRRRRRKRPTLKYEGCSLFDALKNNLTLIINHASIYNMKSIIEDFLKRSNGTLSEDLQERYNKLIAIADQSLLTRESLLEKMEASSHK